MYFSCVLLSCTTHSNLAKENDRFYFFTKEKSHKYLEDNGSKWSKKTTKENLAYTCKAKLGYIATNKSKTNNANSFHYSKYNNSSIVTRSFEIQL